MAGKNKRGATIIDAHGNDLMNVTRVEADGDDLVIRGKIFGAMPMVAKLTPEEARAALKLLDFRTMLFIVSLLFRKSKR